MGALLLGVLGCAGRRAAAPAIQPEWVARVPQDELGPVLDARDELRRARDAIVRAQVAVDDAENTVGVRRSFVRAADQRVEASRKALEAARQQGDPTAIQRARVQLIESRMAKDLADQQLELAEAERDSARAQRELAERVFEARRIALEATEYEVLAERGDPRVRDIDPTRFDRAYRAQRERVREQQQEVARRVATARTIERGVIDTERRLEAFGGAGLDAEQSD